RYGAGVVYQLRQDVSPGQHGYMPGGMTGQFTNRMTHPLLGRTIESVLSPEVAIASAQDPTRLSSGPIFAGTDALDHVHELAKDASTLGGVWLADIAASTLKVHPGDTVSIRYGRQAVELPVAGVYRALIFLPRTGYWQPWDDDIYPSCPTSDCPVPPPFVLIDQRGVETLFRRLGIRGANYAWQAPFRAGVPLTLDAARSLADFELEFEAELHSPGSPFPCCETVLGGRVPLSARLAGGMPAVVTAVKRDTAGLDGAGRGLQAAG